MRRVNRIALLQSIALCALHVAQYWRMPMDGRLRPMIHGNFN
jgi:hypothetical protein